MKKIFALALGLLGGALCASAQTTLFSADFENSSPFGFASVSGGQLYNGSSGSGDRPQSSPFYTSATNGYGVSEGTATLTSGDVNTSIYNNLEVTIRLAAFSISSTGNGMDASDIARIEISPNGGTNYYNTIEVTGNSNAWWSYDGGTGVASTAYDGNASAVVFSPAGGGERTTDGYSTVTVTGLPATANLRFRITLLNSSDNELWTIDDVNLSGTVACTPPSTQASDFAASNFATTSMDISWTRGDGDNVLVVARATSAVNANPASGTGYTANSAYGSGSQIGSGNYVVYNGSGTGVTVTGLTASTTYHFALFEYNNTGVCYLTPGQTGSAATLANPTVSFNTTTSSVSEATATHLVPVTMSNYGGSPVTVSVTATNGTAEPGDYTLNTTSMTFNADETLDVDISINHDNDYANETFTLTLAITAGTAVLGTASHTVTIIDDDTPPVVGFDAASGAAAEGNSGTAAQAINVTMQTAPLTNVTVQVARSGGTATNTTDFSFTTASLTFTPAATYPSTQSASLNVVGEELEENSETVIFALSVTSGTATLGTSVHTYTITDDDAGVRTYYSTGGGSFTATNIWNTNSAGTGTSVTYPTFGNDDKFVIQGGHSITISSNITTNGITVDGTLSLGSTSQIVLSNGSAGPDFQVNGTFVDNGSMGNGISFGSGTTWIMGVAGTLVKTNQSSAQNYQDFYDGGISTIPASANWILRYIGGTGPNLVSINGMHYPNLIVESNSGAWNPALGASRIQGNSDSPTIKGDLDIGGNGSGTVTFYTQNTYATPVTVLGSMTIRSGSTFTNNGSSAGTGVRVAGGNISILGTLSFSAGSGSVGVLELNGNGSQDINGGGTVNLRRLRINKIGTATLSRDLTVNSELSMVAGYLQLGTNHLTVAPSGVTSGGGTSTYVITNGDGTLRQTVTAAAKNFPVGNSSYNPALLSNTGTSDIFSVRVADEVLSGGTSGTPLGSDVVNRTWFVNENTAGGSVGSLTLQWIAADELTGFNRSACYVARHSGTGWTGDTPLSASGAGPYTRTRTGITSFSPFAVASNGALPVELTRFEAHLQQRQVLLQWQTATEYNNDRFVVERSTDGSTFAALGELPGAGTTQVPQAYSFTDRQPVPGANYYRLRQIDFDERFALSPVRAVWLDSSGDIRIAPQPAGDWTKIFFEKPLETDAVWDIFDQAGRLLVSGNIAAERSAAELSLQELPDGIFLLRVRAGQSVWVKKIQKG